MNRCGIKKKSKTKRKELHFQLYKYNIANRRKEANYLLKKKNLRDEISVLSVPGFTDMGRHHFIALCFIELQRYCFVFGFPFPFFFFFFTQIEGLW